MHKRHLSPAQRAWRLANRDALNEYNRERWYQDNYTRVHGAINRLFDIFGYLAIGLILFAVFKFLTGCAAGPGTQTYDEINSPDRETTAYIGSINQNRRGFPHVRWESTDTLVCMPIGRGVVCH